MLFMESVVYSKKTSTREGEKGERNFIMELAHWLSIQLFRWLLNSYPAGLMTQTANKMKLNDFKVTSVKVIKFSKLTSWTGKKRQNGEEKTV